MGSSDLKHGPEWRISLTLNLGVIPFVLVGLLTVQKKKKHVSGLLDQDLNQVLWKRHIEKPWTQKSLKVFIQSLLRNVRKYYFMILWHIMRTGEFKIQKHNSAWRKLIYVPSYFLEKLFSIQFQSTWLSRDLKHSTPKEISQDLLCFWGILNYFYSQCHSYYIINGFYFKIH